MLYVVAWDSEVGSPIIYTFQSQVNPQKEAIAVEVKGILSENNLVTIFHYNDLNAQEWRKLRLRFDENNIKVKVFPSKIASKILSTTQYQNMASLFRGCTAVATEQFGEPSAVKILLKQTKNEDKLMLLGGMVDQQLLSPLELEQYSKIHSMDVLRQEMTTILSQVQGSVKHTLESPSQRLRMLLEQLPNSGRS